MVCRIAAPLGGCVQAIHRPHLLAWPLIARQLSRRRFAVAWYDDGLSVVMSIPKTNNRRWQIWSLSIVWRSWLLLILKLLPVLLEKRTGCV